MPSNFPGGLDSFTTKVDGVTDIMADHVNDLQNSVVAVETLLLAKLTGWINWSTQPVYVSATSIKFAGVDYRSMFPVGTKIRLTQGTVKYFYVLSTSYSGGDTTVMVTGGSDYSVANAVITAFGFSHEASADGFPKSFGWTLTASGGAMTVVIDESNTEFAIHGGMLLFSMSAKFTTSGTASNYVDFNFPVTIRTQSYRTFASMQNETALIAPGIVVANSTTNFNVRRLDGANWTLAANRRASVNGCVALA